MCRVSIFILHIFLFFLQFFLLNLCPQLLQKKFNLKMYFFLVHSVHMSHFNLLLCPLHLQNCMLSSTDKGRIPIYMDDKT